MARATPPGSPEDKTLEGLWDRIAASFADLSPPCSPSQLSLAMAIELPLELPDSPPLSPSPHEPRPVRPLSR